MASSRIFLRGREPKRKVPHDALGILRELECEAAEVCQAHLLGVLVFQDVPQAHKLMYTVMSNYYIASTFTFSMSRLGLASAMGHSMSALFSA